MTIEVENNISEKRREIHQEILSVARETRRVTTNAAQTFVPVSGDEKPHLIETIEGEVYDSFAGDDLVEVVVSAGSEELYYPLYLERGTGIYAEGGDGRKTPWVYYNPWTDSFHWTEGNEAQPFMSPAFDLGRVVFEDRLRHGQVIR